MMDALIPAVVRVRRVLSRPAKAGQVKSFVVASEIVLVRGYFDEGNKSKERRVVLKSDSRRRCASPFDFVIHVSSIISTRTWA